MTRIPGWLRRLRHAIPLLRGHLGKHTEKAREAFLDMQYARRLRRMNARPVYTPPQTYRVVPDYMQPGSYSSVLEVHHGRRGEVHKDVLAATVDRPWLLDDIRAERTRNLAGPDSQVRTDASAPGWSGAQRPTSHQSAGEAHHRDWTQRPLSVVRDGLAPWVEKALAGAKVSDTAYGPLHDTTPFGQWLEQVTGGDPWNGKGSSDEYTDWLFAGMAGAR